GAYGDGFLWVIVVAGETETFGGVVVKLDPRTGRSMHTYHVPDPGGWADIQFLDHAIWLKGDDSGRLVELDTRSGATHVYDLPGWQSLTGLYGQNIALGEGDLWIRINSGRVLRVSPKTGSVIRAYPASRSAAGGWEAIAFGSLWIANFEDDTVWRDRITG
ncbi:MAG TPA: hypothetical protein VJ831_05790, partial [Jatrophihabitantaceae bacterium]|nr:hypothetical protein [Jatrophihabitantaceae bacterium]